MDHHHFLLVSFSFQSHLNPTLRLAAKLTLAGARVSFVTTVRGLNNLKNRPSLPGLSYDSFSDGNDDKDGFVFQLPGYFQQTELIGSVNLKNLLLSKAKQGENVDFVIYGMCLPWVAKVARELHLPSAFFFLQSAASFSVVYHFFKGDGGIVNSDIDLTGGLEIPGLPLLRYDEISHLDLQPTEPMFTLYREHIEALEKHPNPCLLINTFDSLEEESIRLISGRVNIFSIGPLVPRETEEPLICDIFKDSDRETYLRWLDSKPAKSVIYVSFGSIAVLGKKQKEEILEGLMESGHPFLWVIRNDHGEEKDDEVAESYYYKGDGLIVRWCSQVEVLNHFAIGCFVSHCGWNSISESMVGGVAVVGCPQFADQKMNIKMVEEVWGNGVKAAADGGDGVVGREEIKRCLKMAMESEEIQKKCMRLKAMAMEAVMDGGPSYTNLKRLAFGLV